MNSWYNNTLDDTVATNPAASKADIDWMNRNRLMADRNLYANLYIASSLVRHTNFPSLMEYAYARQIKCGLAYSQKSQIDTLLTYNTGKPISQKLWYGVTEIEPYNTGDYAGMTDILKYAYPKLRAAGLQNGVYMGWADTAYWKTICQYSDFINLHCYRTSAQMTPSSIWGYLKGRLEAIAQACKSLNKVMYVNIIYSCEPDFAYEYYKRNSWQSAQNMFLTQYAANASSVMRQFLITTDYSVFVTKYAKQIKP